MRIYLTGFMGSGKSSVGRILAQNLGIPFIDLDHEIEQSSKESIENIFATTGESEFRKREAEQLRKINMKDAVISTGGGAFIFNRDWMMQNGTVIYLEVPFEILGTRIGAETSRPLWKNAAELYKERKKIYDSAHLTVNAARELESIVTEIIDRLGI
jgi:shikimate kinase